VCTGGLSSGASGFTTTTFTRQGKSCHAEITDFCKDGVFQEDGFEEISLAHVYSDFSLKNRRENIYAS